MKPNSKVLIIAGSDSSGGAGIAAMMMSDLPADARVLCILSEGPDE